ncbi:hypothetical protein AC1031_018938 [Aphanomyces cochlioides]|nr:hypothetical protein AC1031_018938 [Aphanomyces cochlioides]
MIDYFMRLPGTPDMTPGYNPAAWMLEVIGAGVDTKVVNSTDYVQIFEDSDERKQLQAALAVHTKPRADVPEMNYTSKRAATNAVQCQYLVQHFMRMYWRTPSYNYTRIVLSVFLAILFGLNRASYYRERASQTYNALWYVVGATVAEIPYVLVSTFLFTIIYYPFVGYKGNVGNVIIYGFELSLYVLMNVCYGQFMAYVMPRVDVAATMGVTLNSIFYLFMGFNPPNSQIPKGYRWFATITPPKYSVSILTAEIFAQCENGQGMGCETMSGVPQIILHELGKSSITVKELTEFFSKPSTTILSSSRGLLLG